MSTQPIVSGSVNGLFADQPSTPRKYAYKDAKGYHMNIAGKAEDRRSSTKEFLPSVLMTNFGPLVEAGFPEIDPEAVGMALGKLQRRELIQKTGIKGREKWKMTAFPAAPKDMKASSMSETKMTALFAVLFNAILEDLGDDNTMRLRAKSEGRVALDSFTHKETVMSDGWFVSEAPKLKIPEHMIKPVGTGKDAKPGQHYGDTFGHFEAKLADWSAAIRDDISKLVHTMNHIMRDDPRRRLTFGMTMENTTFRVWYGDRAQLCCTRPVDWFSDCTALVAFIIKVANCDAQDLGLDLTVKLVKEMPMGNDDIRWVIKAPVALNSRTSRKFYTNTLLSDHRSTSMLGSGTRFWSGGFGAGEARYGLKDCWIVDGRVEEGSILKDLQEKGPCPYLPTVKQHGWVELLPQGKGIDTTGAHLRYPSLGGTAMAINDPLTPMQSSGATSNPPRGLDPPASTHQLASQDPQPPINRKHYRLVINEVGIPLRNLNTLKRVYNALVGAIQAIEYLAGHGYVHRDVSSGNVVEYTKDSVPTGLLIDCEYAKKYAEAHQRHDGEFTGTANFTSSEVAYGHYYESIKQPTIWAHNALHDLESVWWIAFWATAAFRDVRQKGTKHDEENRNLFGKLFGGSAFDMARANAVFKRGALEQWLKPVKHHRSLHPHLIALLQPVVLAYAEVEPRFGMGSNSVDQNTVVKVAAVMKETLKEMMELPASTLEVCYERPEIQVEQITVETPKMAEYTTSRAKITKKQTAAYSDDDEP